MPWSPGRSPRSPTTRFRRSLRRPSSGRYFWFFSCWVSRSLSCLLTAAGIKHQKEVDEDASLSAARGTGRKLDFVVIALLAVAVMALLVDEYLLTGEGPESSIAVLPFVNVTADEAQRSFADGFVAELHNSLTQISDLRVSALTSSLAFRDTDLTAVEIAAELGVQYLLEGTINRRR